MNSSMPNQAQKFANQKSYSPWELEYELAHESLKREYHGKDSVTFTFPDGSWITITHDEYIVDGDTEY